MEISRLIKIGEAVMKIGVIGAENSHSAAISKIINVDKKTGPLANVILLLIGAVIANVIGTTGASMLLIRPFIRMNKNRIRPYHIVFFIFIVSNIGGSLTPIGDPPLFLGFLKVIQFYNISFF